MSYLKRGLCAALAIMATAWMQLASADVIDSYQPFVTTNGSTHTDVVDGGDVSHWFAYDTSTINMSGGQVSHLTLNDSVAMALSGGSLSFLTLLDSTTATVTGANVSWLQVYDNSTASITGPLNLSRLVVSETSHVDIFAADAIFSNGVLSGTWLDGSPYEIVVTVGSPGMPSDIPNALPPNITVHAPTIIDSYQPYVATSGSMHAGIVAGGDVSYFFAYDTSTVDMSGGQVSYLTLQDSASATLSGGEISWLQVFDNSTASITGPLNLSWLVVNETSHVDIYVADAVYDNGLLSGTWLDGSPFVFWAVVGSPTIPSTMPEVLPPNITVHSAPLQH